jgi:hypothetical protein
MSSARRALPPPASDGQTQHGCDHHPLKRRPDPGSAFGPRQEEARQSLRCEAALVRTKQRQGPARREGLCLSGQAIQCLRESSCDYVPLLTTLPRKPRQRISDPTSRRHVKHLQKSRDPPGTARRARERRARVCWARGNPAECQSMPIVGVSEHLSSPCRGLSSMVQCSALAIDPDDEIPGNEGSALLGFLGPSCARLLVSGSF